MSLIPLRCVCGHAEGSHRLDRRRTRCRFCACPGYDVAVPSAPAPTPRELTDMERVPCTCVPELDSRTGCPACTAYGQNMVLLTTGERVGKAVWFQAKEIAPTEGDRL